MEIESGDGPGTTGSVSSYIYVSRLDFIEKKRRHVIRYLSNRVPTENIV